LQNNEKELIKSDFNSPNQRGKMRLTLIVIMLAVIGLSVWSFFADTDEDDIWKSSHINSPLNLNSTNAVLLDYETGNVLYFKNPDQRIYPASMVKMMTALVAIENIDDLHELVFLCETIFPPIHAANAVTAGFLPNESVRAVDLLYGLLLPSGAECAVGLAYFVAGGEAAFVELMNQRSQEIGMNATRFANTTGLHNDNQYTTVMDMATLLIHGLENETFYRIITTARHSTAATSLREGGITFHSTLFNRMDSAEFHSSVTGNGGVIRGGRTGFTNQAGQCLASFAIVNGRKYILVTAGADARGNHLTRALHIDDAFAVYMAINQ